MDSETCGKTPAHCRLQLLTRHQQESTFHQSEMYLSLSLC
uniref:Uncharacterized protein n=1 Tax=Anguilla anguilla TaxID=7936 RepID=A0A0E9WV18_ANGAN